MEQLTEEDKYLVEAMMRKYRCLQTIERIQKERERMIQNLLKNEKNI